MIYQESSLEGILDSDKLLLIPIPKNWKDHYLETSICALYVSNGEVDTILPLDLVDEINLTKTSFQFNQTIFTTNKRLLETEWNVNSYDINTLEWLNGTYKKRDEPTDYKALLRIYNYPDKNKYISPLKHLEYCRTSGNNFLNLRVVGSDVQFYRNIVYPGISFLEKSKLYVDSNLYKEAFTKVEGKSSLYLNYNLHTLTGRPSNTFDNVNFSALVKDSLQRECIISRYQSNGKLYEFDFDAYHIRLVAKILDYKFTEESIHSQFGKEYFNVDELSPEQYQEAKNITFKNMYSTVNTRYSNNFFLEVEKLKTVLWSDFQLSGQLVSPISGRVIVGKSSEEMYKSKLFNYFIQAIETDFSMIIIDRIRELLLNYTSKFILYTYDSFLFDVHLSETEELLPKIYSILNVYEMHVKMQHGTNYRYLQNQL